MVGLRCWWAVACSRGVFRYTGVGKAGVFMLALGRMAVSWMEGMKKWRKQTTMFIVVHFRDALCGPPIPCVPPCVSPSSIPLLNELEPPTSLWKGEGRMQWGWHFQVRWGGWIWAHIPQERGGAHCWVVACSWGRNRVVRVKVVIVGWVEDEQNSTVMGLMWILNSACPCR